VLLTVLAGAAGTEAFGAPAGAGAGAGVGAGVGTGTGAGTGADAVLVPGGGGKLALDCASDLLVTDKTSARQTPRAHQPPNPRPDIG